MNTINRYFRLIIRYTKLSIEDLRQFPFEILMKIIALSFQVLFIWLFWTSITNLGVSYTNWNKYEIFILTGCGTISSSVSQLTFGFRDIEEVILTGDLDKFLMRPVNLIFSIMAEKFFIFWVVAEFIVGLAIILVAKIAGNIALHNIVPALILIFFGTFALRFMYGTISILCFWVGRISSLRDIIFSIDIAKDYPIDIFNTTMINLLTYVFPISLLATYPAKILLGKVDNVLYIIIISIMLFVFWFIIFRIVLKRALLKYQSTGS